MASANEPGLIRVMVEHVNTGIWERAFEFRSDSSINSGKSPDGVLANLTFDKQVVVPLCAPVANGNDIIHVMAKIDAADGIDVSDGVYLITVTDSTGTERQLNAADLGIITDFPAGTIAARWFDLGAGYTVPVGTKLKIGSISLKGNTVLSLEDDT